MGPIQPAPEWRAHARLGYSTHVSLVLGGPLPPDGLIVVTTSRSTEKSSAYTCTNLEAVISHVVSNYGMTGIVELVLRSDSGPHYRCARLLGAASQWLGVLRALNKTENHGMMTVEIKYGPPYHGKSDEDRIMGQLRQMKESIADERAITTIGGLIAGWRERTDVHRYKHDTL